MSSKQTSATSSGTSRPAARTASIAPSSDEVVDGEHRGGRIVELEQTAHPVVTAGWVDRCVCDERRIERDPGGGQGGLVASPPVACGRHLVGFDDEADAAMAERDQVLDELLRAAEAVAEDDVGLRCRKRCGRSARRGHRTSRAGAGCFFDRSLTGAITIPSTRWAIISSITSRSTSRSARVSQRSTRKPARRATSSAPRTIKVKNGLATSGTINASVPVRCAAQPSGESARNVAELGDRLLDASPRLGADPLARVDHARDGHRRRRLLAARRP